MTIKTCKFRIGDVYLFHATDPGCESGTSLWGIVNDRDTDGRICLETSSADLKKYKSIIIGLFCPPNTCFADFPRAKN